MDTSIFTAVVAGSFTLLGGALAWFAQRSNQRFQIEHEKSKRESDLREKETFLALARLTTAHRQVSVLSREFSQDSIDINWRAEMSEAEYDQHYMSLRMEADELRAICALYEPSLSESVEKLYNQTNIFWGNFKNVLYLTAEGKKDMTTLSLDRAHAAAIDISNQAQALKARISERAKVYRSES
jgi:hypothetical protein